MLSRVMILGFVCLFFSGCTTQQPATSGYFPIPEEFTGVWEPGTLRTGHKNMSIEQTPTGAIITENSFYGPKSVPIIYQTTLNIFAYENNRAYAIGEDRTVVRGTGLDIHRPTYYFFLLNIKDPKKILENYYTDLHISKDKCRRKLTENDMKLPSSVHWNRIRNRSCGKTPLSSKDEWGERMPYFKKTSYLPSFSSAAR